MKFQRTNSILPMRSKKDLSLLTEKIFRAEGSAGRLGIEEEKLSALVAEVAKMYFDNPYHNFQHAVDTVYTMAWILSLPGFKKNLPDMHRYMLMLVALTHDVEHPGNDNQWEIKTHSPLAQRYKNISVIENHSLSMTKQLLAKPELNVMPKKQEREAYDLMDELILCTDFAWHKVFLGELKEGVESNHFNYQEPYFLSLVSRSLIKAADISNTTKPFEQARAWGERVMAEFWAQGEKEKEMNLPLGPFNNASTTEFNSAQAGFIKFAAWDLFVMLTQVEEHAQEMVDEMHNNQESYEKEAAKLKPPSS